MNSGLEKILIAMSYVFWELNFLKSIFLHTTSNLHYSSLQIILPQTDKNISKFIKSTTAISQNKSFEQVGKIIGISMEDK